MSKLQELINRLCPEGVPFKELLELLCPLKKGTLKITDLIPDGEFPVINSGRDLYGRYNHANNQGPAITIAARGEYAGWISFFDCAFWAGGLCYPYKSRDESKLMAKFVYYYLKSKEQFIMDSLVARGSIPALNKSDLDKFLIPVPPIEVQEEIVKILDRFADYAAELQAELQARREQYEYYRNRLLDFGRADRASLHDDVTTWGGYNYKIAWKTMGEIFSMKAGKAISSSEIFEGRDNESYPCFGANGLRGYVHSKNQYGPKVIIGRQGALCGNVAYADETFYATDHAIVVDVKENNPRYVFHVLTHKDLNQFKTAGAQPGLSVEILKKVVIPVPEYELQEKIATILDRFEALVNDLTTGLPAEIAAVKEQYEYYCNKLLTFREKSA